MQTRSLSVERLKADKNSSHIRSVRPGMERALEDIRSTGLSKDLGELILLALTHSGILSGYASRRPSSQGWAHGLAQRLGLSVYETTYSGPVLARYFDTREGIVSYSPSRILEYCSERYGIEQMHNMLDHEIAFAICHEIGHHIMRRVLKRHANMQYKDEETYCDVFAGRLMIPKHEPGNSRDLATRNLFTTLLERYQDHHTNTTPTKRYAGLCQFSELLKLPTINQDIIEELVGHSITLTSPGQLQLFPVPEVE